MSPDKVPEHTRSANASEKDARAAIYGAVKRVLSDKDIVILDGLNYIKGWRYQLYCEAKSYGTPSCIFQIGCALDKAKEVNEERLHRRERGEADVAGEEPYEPSNWENLVFRHEEPNPMTRWDSPLFALVWDDNETQARRVFGDMWDTMAGDGRKVVRPNQSTTQRGPVASGDFLYMLDRETQDIVKQILDQQGEDGGGDVKITRTVSSQEEELVIELPAGRKLGLAQLQRLRRAFVNFNRGGIGLQAVGDISRDKLRDSFVQYLNSSFEQDG